MIRREKSGQQKMAFNPLWFSLSWFFSNFISDQYFLENVTVFKRGLCPGKWGQGENGGEREESHFGERWKIMGWLASGDYSAFTKANCSRSSRTILDNSSWSWEVLILGQSSTFLEAVLWKEKRGNNLEPLPWKSCFTQSVHQKYNGLPQAAYCHPLDGIPRAHVTSYF